MSGASQQPGHPAPSFSARTAVALTACGLLFLAQCYWHRGFTVDDAYISFRYARNLVEGRGLVFNEGERVEGYSNFLWVLMVAGVMKLGLASPEVATKVVGTVCGLLVVLLGPAAVARTTRLRGGACLLGALALAAWPPLAYWSISGLETSLFALLLTAGLLVWLSARGARSGLGAGTLMALARRPAMIETHISGGEGAFAADHPLDQLLLRRLEFRRGYVYLGHGLFLRRDLHQRRAPPPAPGPAPARTGPG